MRLAKIRNIACILIVLIFLCLFTGCAVLTRSQVKEVEKFAKASQEYNELPGSLVQSYGVLLRNNKLLSITRNEFGQRDKQGGIETADAKDAWETIQAAYKVETDFTEAGKQIDAALSILRIYSDLLTSLTADNFTDALSEKAEKLGKSLDDATDDYNNKYRQDNPIKKTGGIIAMGVRSVGGIFIRQKQASILQMTIREANPLIIELMDEVKIIASNKLKPSLENYEENFIGKGFKSVVNNKKEIDISTVVFVYDNLYKTRQSIILSDQISKAAEDYKNAHTELVNNTRVRKTLKEAIRQIETLSKEVNAAKKVKNNINK